MKTYLLSLIALLSSYIILAQGSSQETFWTGLQGLCGKAYHGTIIHAPENDTLFAGKEIVMHVRDCKSDRIRIPLIVGDNRSRTWILTRSTESMTLKHDHRHMDGTEDQITLYGGTTSNSGSATMQMFPADQYTADLLPAAATNVWWLELVADSHLTYNLRRMGTDRYFSIRFDLTQEAEVPEAPWGWKG